eukprot:3187130-Pleurochrysis_carterae.AAC.4
MDGKSGRRDREEETDDGCVEKEGEEGEDTDCDVLIGATGTSAAEAATANFADATVSDSSTQKNEDLPLQLPIFPPRDLRTSFDAAIAAGMQGGHL